MWMAYYSLEPFGPRRDNIHAGLIASTLANCNRRKNSKPFTPNDFMLKDEETQKQEKMTEFFGKMRTLAASSAIKR